MASSTATQADAGLYFGTNAPTGTDFQDNATHIVTSDGTSTGTVLELWKYDAETGIWVMIPAGGGTSCPAPMTRNALNALRASSQLMPGCSYSITDYSRGCLAGRVTFVTLQASDVNVLSMDADVKTTLDTVAWRGKYDIDTHRITSLEDNRGNRVYGRYGNEVDRFPWTNNNWFEVVVDNADVLVDCTTNFRVNNTRFESNASVNLTGATGYIFNSSFSNGSIVALTNAVSVAVQQSNFDSRARLYAENVNRITLFYHSQASEAYWYVRNRANVRAYYSRFSSTARVYYYGGTGHYFYYADIGSLGYVRQYGGDSRVYYSDINSYGFVTFQAGTGFRLLAGSHVSSRATVNLSNAARVYYSRFGSQSTFTATAANHYRNDMSSYSRITTAFSMQNVTASGSFTQTLTANNTNTYRGYGQNSLI